MKGSPMKNRITSLLVLGVLVLSVNIALAETISFTKLTGVTGGSPAGTAVYRADLSALSLTTIQSITLHDASGGVGGAPGQLSGFDLDAIIISDTSVGTAAAAQALVGLPGFDYSPAGTLFTPGTQRPVADPKLFGTGPTGLTVDNTVATLAAFDANSTTFIPLAFGFISMGDGGQLIFKLTGPVSTAGKFLYIGEVGDNGEIAAVVTVALPEPSSIMLAFAGLVGLAAYGRRLRRA
jgi:hypothetical protein